MAGTPPNENCYKILMNQRGYAKKPCLSNSPSSTFCFLSSLSPAARLGRILRPGSLGQTVPTTTFDSTQRLGRCHGAFISPRCLASHQVVSFNRYYTWSPGSIDTTLEYVPMLWGERQIDQWTNTLNRTIGTRRVTHALAFNELSLLSHVIRFSTHRRSRRPQQTGQSNMSSQQGADLWRSYMQPLKAQGIRLGAPATSSAPSGKTWLQDFFAVCGDCTVDFVALHWYGINSTQFVLYLQDFHNSFQRPIWVTEWACQVSTLAPPFIRVPPTRRHCRTLSMRMNNARNKM